MLCLMIKSLFLVAYIRDSAVPEMVGGTGDLWSVVDKPKL